MKVRVLHIVAFYILMMIPFFAFADDHIEVGIDEQLGSYVPLDVQFFNSDGLSVLLKDLVSSSDVTVLAFVYYRCPGICSPLLFELSDIVSKSDLELGYDYQIVSVSFDEKETPEIAAEKKRTFLSAIEGEVSSNAWMFLTGDSSNIRKISDAVGFYFKREGEQFRHSGAFIFINKEGKICRYLFPGYTDKGGFSILPFDFKMAVLETTEGKVSPTIAKVLQFCFSYDPEGKGYVLNVTRIFGVAIILFAAIFFIVIKVKPKKQISKTR